MTDEGQAVLQDGSQHLNLIDLKIVLSIEDDFTWNKRNYRGEIISLRVMLALVAF